MKKFKLMVTCAAGIESLVAKELRDLGYEVKVDNGMVLFDGTIEDIIKANVWLRTADRVKIIVGSFEAKTFDQLFEGTKALSWETLIPMDGQFPVEGRSQKSELHSVPDIQAITKKAIATKLGDFYHRRTRLPETGGLFPLEVRVNKNMVYDLLDTTGPSLFKRGYRVAKGDAPLKENMAAALILLSNWHPKTMPFLDPMCGSGTLPIEAAMIARNIAPGMMREFAFDNWDWVPKDLIKKVKEEADAQADYESEFDISGSDVNGEMINYAKVNAQEIGLLHDITFKQLAVQDFKTDKEDGVVVTNPPYGQRLGDIEQAEKLYRDLGKVFIPMNTWSKYYLTSDLNFEKFYGKKATKRRKLYNGRIRTDYFQYWAEKRHQK
ncbi:THUMP domain-containing class I SAM-dependent RNA methyltransferase [Fructilactobacillus sp. Tb1]|uniref:THUMP domain-containing class I SAM-dependent RNA methyltransferase n=1 Tax=Fructilactobacillus sp. Tb1 TaxID=3422304 RepID=UPI003D266781